MSESAINGVLSIAVVTSYLLAVCASQPATGWLADRFGRKQVFLASLAAFTVASLACAAAPNLIVLVVFRVLQGLGGGALMPVGMAIAFDLFPKTRQGRAMSIWGMSAMAAPAVGPHLQGVARHLRQLALAVPDQSADRCRDRTGRPAGRLRASRVTPVRSAHRTADVHEPLLPVVDRHHHVGHDGAVCAAGLLATAAGAPARLHGLSWGLTTSPGLIAGIGHLPAHLMAQGSAVRSLSGQVSGALAVSVLGAVVAAGCRRWCTSPRANYSITSPWSELFCRRLENC